MTCLVASCQKADFGDVDDAPAAESGNNSRFETSAHVAILVEQSADGTADTMYVSLREWDGVPSSASASPTAARQIADSYSEGTLSGWHIPTLSEAVRIKSVYPAHSLDTLYRLNARIAAAGGDTVAVTKSDGATAARYLCARGDSTFSFLNGSYLPSGKTVKYRLLLVRHSAPAANTIDFRYNDTP